MCNYLENCRLEQIFSCICNENISYCSDCYEKHKQSSDPDTIHSKRILHLFNEKSRATLCLKIQNILNCLKSLQNENTLSTLEICKEFKEFYLEKYYKINNHVSEIKEALKVLEEVSPESITNERILMQLEDLIIFQDYTEMIKSTCSLDVEELIFQMRLNRNSKENTCKFCNIKQDDIEKFKAQVQELLENMQEIESDKVLLEDNCKTKEKSLQLKTGLIESLKQKLEHIEKISKENENNYCIEIDKMRKENDAIIEKINIKYNTMLQECIEKNLEIINETTSRCENKIKFYNEKHQNERKAFARNMHDS